MSEAHAFSGLKVGDHFIHRFDFDGHTTYAYGTLLIINAQGQYVSDYEAQQHPGQEMALEPESHQVLGKISRKAYALARLRGWPNSRAGVDEILAFSMGMAVPLSLKERALLWMS